MIPPSQTSITAAGARQQAGLSSSNILFNLIGAAAEIGRTALILLAYKKSLKRLTRRVKVDPFDDPVLWAELKSSAWADATKVAQRKSQNW